MAELFKSHRGRCVGGKVYATAIHLIAIFGMMYVMVNETNRYSRIASGEPYVKWEDSWPSKTPYILPDGVAKVPAQLECRGIYIKNSLLCKIWFRPEGLYRLEFAPPALSTAWSFEKAPSVAGARHANGWMVTIDTYDDSETPWTASFPILTVRDTMGIGIPDAAIVWKGTQAIQVYDNENVWSTLEMPEVLEIIANRQKGIDLRGPNR